MSERAPDERCGTCKEMHPCDYFPRLLRYKMRPTRKCKKPVIMGPGEPGSPYYPSNGTEGEYFTARWCERCLYWNKAEVDPEVDIACPIYVGSLMAESSDKGPNQWVHGEDGWGSCTMFDSRKPLDSDYHERRWSPAKEREMYSRAMRGE